MIDEILHEGDTSAEVSPSAALSEAIIEPLGEPSKTIVYLQVKSPNGGWINMARFIGVFTVSTSDNNLLYRFKADNIGKDGVRVYLT